MEKPKIALKTPILVTLDPGKYYWCACGKSNKQPFCDGSHKAFGLSPLAFEIKEQTKAWLCVCKQSGKKPYCDGTHRNLE